MLGFREEDNLQDSSLGWRQTGSAAMAARESQILDKKGLDCGTGGILPVQ